MMRNPQNKPNPVLKTVNLKQDMPLVHEALERLTREIALARQQGYAVLKVVHGYGSHGVGGEIRVAVQKRLVELAQNGQLHAVVFGEDWRISNEATWQMMQRYPELKRDADVGRSNSGITVIYL